jgi:hypothetical protein
MYKNFIATCFTLLFLALIVAPTVIVAIDDSFDTSIFYSITEEEETGKTKNIVSPYSLQVNDYATSSDLKRHQIFGYTFKTYPKPHLNLISPPPEISII